MGAVREKVTLTYGSLLHPYIEAQQKCNKPKPLYQPPFTATSTSIRPTYKTPKNVSKGAYSCKHFVWLSFVFPKPLVYASIEGNLKM